MHKELRDQVRTQAISDIPRENPANSPEFFFIIIIKIHTIWKRNIICKARSNLMMPI
jgi:hypothetical protein